MLKIFHVGGEPMKEAFLAEELEKMIDKLQLEGWIIKDINHFINKRAWDMSKQKYVETPEYIICAYKEELDDLEEDIL